MKKLPLAVAVATLLGVPVALASGVDRGPVFDGDVSTWVYPESTRTRAEVMAETEEALRAGTHAFTSETTPWEYGPATLSRERVAAEAREAMRLGLFNDPEAGPSKAQLHQVHLAGSRAEGSMDAEATGAEH